MKNFIVIKNCMVMKKYLIANQYVMMKKYKHDDEMGKDTEVYPLIYKESHI